MSALDDLKYCQHVISGQRFAGFDQNPKGVRDLLCSAIFRIEEELNAALAAAKTGAGSGEETPRSGV